MTPARSIRRAALTAACALSTLTPAAGLAEPLLGTWATEIDSSRTYGHVRTRACGAAICGSVISAWDEAGAQITTPNVGREIFWGMVPKGAGTYADGRIHVPRMRADFPVTMEVTGDRLRLRACNAAGLCRSQTWTRVR
jgi:uncharacterized protein (DUF2147 family)